ncbi:glycosyltransferase [Candidatus Methylacidithermus pantelleriae]|nr:glycosyltransferase [Candidatus Methylacidithermus pantelleriae]
MFLVRELQALSTLGAQVEVHSLWGKSPVDPAEFSLPPGITAYPAPGKKYLVAPIRLLWEVVRDPSLIRSAWYWLRKGRFNKWQDIVMTLLGTFFACARVKDFRTRNPDLFHGAWATAPATAAAVLGRLCRKPFSFGAHAYDLYRGGGDALLFPKLEKASFVHTSTQLAQQELVKLCPGATSKIILARRGLFYLPDVTPRDSFAPGGELRILSVGRLVPKKGWEIQWQAARLLRQEGVRFHWVIVGTGPLEKTLRAQIRAAQLDHWVTLAGELPYSNVEKAYRRSHLFWFTGVTAPDGDRDGFPNVIAEAWAYELPVIATRTGAVTEALVHGVNGWLLKEPHPRELAEVTIQLWQDPALRTRLGKEGRRWVQEHYLVTRNVLPLWKAIQEVTRSYFRPAQGEELGTRQLLQG